MELFWILDDEELAYIYCLVPAHDGGHRLCVVSDVDHLFLGGEEILYTFVFSGITELKTILEQEFYQGWLTNPELEVTYVCDWVFDMFYDLEHLLPVQQGMVSVSVPRVFFVQE